LSDYQGSAVDLAGDFTVAASNVITTLAFGREVSDLFSNRLFCTSEYWRRFVKLTSTNSCGCARIALGFLFKLGSGQGQSFHF